VPKRDVAPKAAQDCHSTTLRAARSVSIPPGFAARQSCAAFNRISHKLSATLAADLPVSIYNSSFQTEPNYRIRDGLTWHV